MEGNSKPKSKILYVITQSEWGGAQRYVFDLATHLTDNFEVYVAAGKPNGGKELLNKFQISTPDPVGDKFQNKPEIQIIQLKHLLRKISPINDILAIFELARLYQTLKPDIVHLNSSKAGILGSFARLMAYGVRPMIVYTVHGWVFNEPNRRFGRWLYRFLEKFTAPWKDKIIVLSDKDFDDGIKAGIDKKKLVKIPLGIEMPKFLDKEEARQHIVKLSNCQIANSDQWVGTIANLYKTKGIDILIEAVKTVVNVEDVENVKFVVIGEGPERKRLENLIKKYNLENTILLIGALDNAAQYLPAFDIFVLPSRKEGLPYTLLEAMAQGTPIIAANTGGVSSLIKDKENGLLVEPENAQQLSNAILWAINNYEEMKKCGLRASETVKPLAMKNMIELTKSIYCLHQSGKSQT